MQFPGSQEGPLQTLSIISLFPSKFSSLPCTKMHMLGRFRGYQEQCMHQRKRRQISVSTSKLYMFLYVTSVYNHTTIMPL